MNTQEKNPDLNKFITARFPVGHEKGNFQNPKFESTLHSQHQSITEKSDLREILLPKIQMKEKEEANE